MRNVFAALALTFALAFIALPHGAAHAQDTSWFCKTWHNFPYQGWTTTHCTQSWHWSGGVRVSDNPAFVPNYGYPTTGVGVPTHFSGVSRFAAAAPAPAAHSFSGGSTNHYQFGQCTYGAAALAHDNVDWLGNAWQWAYNARARGMAVGYAPVAGSTAVFAPGYHTPSWGTSSGHVAHVDAVSGNRILITEMNNSYYGGFGRYDTVWVTVIYGAVQFIY